MSYAVWNVLSPQQTSGSLEQPRLTWLTLKYRLSEYSQKQAWSVGLR